jgi:hypothetical protein
MKDIELTPNRPFGKGRKKHVGKQAKHNWDLIRHHYVYGYVVTDEATGQRTNTFPTYRELSEKFECPEDSIRHRGSKENWVLMQTQYRETLDKQRQIESFQSPELSEQEQFNARILWDINKLFGVLEGLFEQYEYLELGADGNFHFRMPNTYDASEDEGSDVKPIKVQDLKGIVDILDKIHLLSSRITESKSKEVDGKPISSLNQSDIEALLAQRDSLVRQLDGKQNRDSE